MKILDNGVYMYLIGDDEIDYLQEHFATDGLTVQNKKIHEVLLEMVMKNIETIANSQQYIDDSRNDVAEPLNLGIVLQLFIK